MRDSILRRVAALSADARAVIQAAAVVEVPAREELLRRAAGLTRARTGAALCEALGAAILVVADGAYRLCHALAAHAIRETIALPERQRLHLRVARALEAADEPVPLAQLAYHYRQGGDQQRWLRYAERAADAYMAVGEDCEGTSYLIDALTAPGLARATRTTLALKLGEAALFGRVPGGAIEALRRVLNDASLPRGVRGEIRYSLGRLLFEVVDVRGGQSELTRAAEDLRGRPGLRARALARLAASPPSPGQPLDRRRLVEEAVEAAAQVQDPALRTEVIGTRAYVLLTSGDPAGWEAERTLPRDARSIGHKLELVRTCKHLASAACTLGHYERARALLAEAEGLRHELGHERFAVGLATVRAQLDWNTGRWTGLEERARRLVEASPHTPLMARASKLVVAWLLLCRGAVREAEQDFRALLEAFPDDWLSASGLATILLARDEPEAARELTDRGHLGRDTARLHSAYHQLTVFVDALLACGALDEARELVRRFDRGLRRRDPPAASAALAQCRGAVAEGAGRHHSAARHFAAAERAWRALPAPHRAATVAERRGLCLLAAGDERGAGCLLRSLEGFEELASGWDAARVRAALRKHQISLPYPWRGGPPAYRFELSPREREVAGLVSAGLTNREIAQGLFLSTRTVDSHVASVMRKLGIRSRTDLAQRLEQRPAAAINQ